MGLWVEEGDPICSIVDEETGKETTVRHKESERATVETVRALGRTGANDGPLSRVRCAEIDVFVFILALFYVKSSKITST